MSRNGRRGWQKRIATATAVLGNLGPGLALAALAAAGCAQLGASKETAAAAAAREKAAAARTFVYVGMAGGEIAGFELNTASGGLARRGGATIGRAPSSLASSDERQVLIVTDEAAGVAVSLSVNPKTGALAPVGRAGTAGAQPSGVTVDRSGKYALVANSASASAAVLAIKPNGALDAAEAFGAGAGAHAIAVHPSNEVAFVANFRAGTVSQFSFNTGTGTLTPKPGPALGLPTGSGPTRFACHPSGRWVYILSETNDTISVHVFDEDIRALSVLASQIISTLPDETDAKTLAKKSRPGDLRLGPAGHFLYATNRGHDSVATYGVDAAGTLTLVSHQPSGGKTPAALATDPGGAYLFVANSGSRNLTVFRLDDKSGAPVQLATVSLPAAPLAVHAVRFDPDGP